ncbi:polyphosphate kinase 1 [Myxococcota bacterium]|nr:polyphosphate kinase 1 [Myxococcota bacterium]
MDLRAPELYLNRELSWLEFNRRVLHVARRPDVPVVERLKFVSIAASNLDEFYMVRIGGLERQVRKGKAPVDPSGDDLRPAELLAKLGLRARELNLEIAKVFTELVRPELAENAITFAVPEELDDADRAFVAEYYAREVHPCLTPIAIDPTHPFPLLKNNSLNLALRIEVAASGPEAQSFERPEGPLLALVQVPSVLSRFLVLPSGGSTHRFMALEDVISMHVAELFPGHRILEARPFRVTRASDLDIAEEDAEDLLATIEDELRRRDKGEPVRLEVSSATSDELVAILRDMLDVREIHVDRHPGFVAMSALFGVYRKIDAPKLRDVEHVPATSPQLRYSPTIFRAIAERDILLHHPYETFRHVVDFIDKAASDPDVVAIKQTLYRTSGDSPIIRALARAAEAGKQVTVLVELKARFDEANNIAWARALEESGAHVVYGLIGLKTHAKMMLVLRREGDDLKRYLHLGTGNYNPTTAKLYTDLSLFTAREDVTQDALRLFNVLTGYAELQGIERLVVAPFDLRQRVIAMIDREIEHAQAGRPCGIRAKLNALSDPEVIRALYRASQHKVPIDLLVRGICCLRPAIPGVSETIHVKAIVDRFLEHARIYWFANGGADEVYLSSADWMPRNFDRRIEVAFPILDPALKKRITDEIIPIELSDNTFAWELTNDGRYVRATLLPGGQPVRAQQAFVEQLRDRTAAARTTIRPEVTGATTMPPVMSPALRAAKAQTKRRRSDI